MENLNNQQFNEEREIVEVSYYEPMDDEIMVTTDSNEEETGSKVNGLVVAGAIAAGAVSALVAGKALYGRFKKKKAEKEIGIIKKKIIEEFTKTGEINEYDDSDIEEIARYNYFLATQGIKDAKKWSKSITKETTEE